jgi:predicted transcriptional regulator of viral defense system
VKTAAAYGDLLAMGRPVVTTREAATRWRTGQGTAGRRLRALEEASLVRRLRRGLWALEREIEPFALPPYLTAPFPAYVSFWSALSRHEMIEQIPRRVSVASLDRARLIETSLGAFEVHHLAPELFGGYEGSDRSGYLATPEKAIFDLVYVRAAAGSRAYLPELTMPQGFDGGRVDAWVERIAAARLRTLVSRRLAEIVGQAGAITRPASRR